MPTWTQWSRARRPKVTLLYHYMYPDDVVSARHFDGLGRGLHARGWDVEMMPCNRGSRDESRTYPVTERWDGIQIHRVWRPGFKQGTTFGRLANMGWMLAGWSQLAMRPASELPDVVIIGTEPALSILLAAVYKRARPSMRVAHWCFDMYPEAAIADGLLAPTAPAIGPLKAALRVAYRSCDLIADLGPCMRELLCEYTKVGGGAAPRHVTLEPWALSEPAAPTPSEPAVAGSLFGSARLKLLYSGNFGRAHSYTEFLELADRLRGTGVHFCFGTRGNRDQQLREAVGGRYENVSFAPFAPESELEARLASADIHLASLRPGWEGIVIPSKFFGSLAAGRPVLFAGSPRSSLARWIAEHRIGWVLSPETMAAVAAEMARLANDPAELTALQSRCHAVYQANFSSQNVVDRWDRELRKLLPSDGSLP